MADRRKPDAGVAVPRRRLSRLARFGGMATGIAGSMIADGTRRLARGERPGFDDLLLTPANALRVTEELAQLRGAAMKVGQILSMDAGDLLPPELSEVLARLRADARPMPGRQLREQLVASWGTDWRTKVARFDVAPMAAASIGQVHRAETRDGRDLAVKIQYPGVRESIDSDVGNVATLVRLTGQMPKGFDISPYLDEARRQLHAEADYLQEGRYMARFGEQLAGDPHFIVPRWHEDLTTEQILAMEFVPGTPVERLVDESQDLRNTVMRRLFELLLREMFDLRLMQTDPNFANYRYQADTGRIVLLDFGATREIPPALSDGYRAMLRAAVASDREAIIAAATAIGFLGEDMPESYAGQLADLIVLSLEPVGRDGFYDFSDTTHMTRLREAGMALQEHRRDFVNPPPPETMFLQRKIAGMFLLAGRLKARLNIREQMMPWVEG